MLKRKKTHSSVPVTQFSVFGKYLPKIGQKVAGVTKEIAGFADFYFNNPRVLLKNIRTIKSTDS